MDAAMAKLETSPPCAPTSPPRAARSPPRERSPLLSGEETLSALLAAQPEATGGVSPSEGGVSPRVGGVSPRVGGVSAPLSQEGGLPAISQGDLSAISQGGLSAGESQESLLQLLFELERANTEAYASGGLPSGGLPSGGGPPSGGGLPSGGRLPFGGGFTPGGFTPRGLPLEARGHGPMDVPMGAYVPMGADVPMDDPMGADDVPMGATPRRIGRESADGVSQPEGVSRADGVSQLDGVSRFDSRRPFVSHLQLGDTPPGSQLDLTPGGSQPPPGSQLNWTPGGSQPPPGSQPPSGSQSVCLTQAAATPARGEAGAGGGLFGADAGGLFGADAGGLFGADAGGLFFDEDEGGLFEGAGAPSQLSRLEFEFVSPQLRQAGGPTSSPGGGQIRSPGGGQIRSAATLADRVELRLLGVSGVTSASVSASTGDTSLLFVLIPNPLAHHPPPTPPPKHKPQPVAQFDHHLQIAPQPSLTQPP